MNVLRVTHLLGKLTLFPNIVNEETSPVRSPEGSSLRQWPSERHQFGLDHFLGGRNTTAILERDACVAALILVKPPNIGSFVGVVDGDHVVTNLALELANGYGLPILSLAEVVIGGEKLGDGDVAGRVRRPRTW